MSEEQQRRARRAATGVRTAALWAAVKDLVDALAALGRRAAESGVQARVHGSQGDADTLADLLPERAFDLVCCHGVLEVVDDPTATLRVLADALADDGHLSLLVAGRLATVWARALAGEFGQAHTALTSPDGRWGAHDPLPRRFDLAQLRALVESAGLQVEHWHGVRLLADLVPSTSIDTDAERAALVALEEALAGHPAYPFLGELGAALHLLARRG